MKICEYSQCTNCGACVNVCPQNCISLINTEDYFVVPHIDEEKCINCKRCIQSCPNNYSVNIERYSTPEVFAAYAQDVGQMKNCTSGGIFSVLAEKILYKSGKVYGAANNEIFQAEFLRVENEHDLYKLLGSKYVQSNTGTMYRSALEDLKAGREVLFVGLPCQIAGLYSFLGRDYENLYTIDLVCRGVPSEELLQEYLKVCEKDEQSKLVYLNWRNKSRKWKPMSYGSRVKMKFANGKVKERKITNEPYYCMFLKNIAMKESCYSCRFNGFPRMGDITLGDFAGLGVIEKNDFYNYNGISQVLINSKKGKNLYESGRGKINDVERTLDECCFFNLNLWLSVIPNPKRGEFLMELQQNGIESAIKKYVCTPKDRVIQIIKDFLILLLGEKRILYLMHKKRQYDGEYPDKWSPNKYFQNIDK